GRAGHGPEPCALASGEYQGDDDRTHRLDVSRGWIGQVNICLFCNNVAAIYTRVRAWLIRATRQILAGAQYFECSTFAAAAFPLEAPAGPWGFVAGLLW